MKPVSALLSVALLALFPACGADIAEESATAVVWDSSGVEIVESPVPLLGGAAAWYMAEEPSIIVGLSVDGDEGLFGIGSSHNLSDNRIVIANRGTSQLKYYGPDGRLEKTVGRQGQGPGEFTRLSQTWRLTGDTVVAYDIRQARLSWFGTDGDLVRTSSLAPLGLYRVVGLLRNGLIGMYMSLPGRSAAEGTVFPMDETFVRVSFGGDLADTIVTLSGTPVEIKYDRGDPSFASIPFGVHPVWTVHEGRLYHGPSDTFVVNIYDPDRGLVRVIRRRDPDLTLTKDIITAREDISREAARARGPSQLRDTERYLATVRYPNRFTAYDYLLVDALGNLWVRGTWLPTRDVATWSVFDTGGRWLVEVTMPATFRPRVVEIGADYVLARERDEADLEYVARYDLVKPAG